MSSQIITPPDPRSRAAARGLSDNTIRNLFIIPTLAFLIIFNIFPLIWSLGYSFTDFRASTKAPANFVGLDNYRQLLSDPNIWKNFTITAKYVLISVTGQVIVGFGMALLLNRDMPAKGLITTLLLLPMMLSMAVVVAIPMYLMYRAVGLNDSHLGLIILYTAFNLSFPVWLMKGFIDEIPHEYEEAALVDGYTRIEAFFKIVLPEAMTGIAATAVFCFITAWNEYAFALIMTNRNAQTAPPYIPSQIGSGLPDWTVIASGTLIFLIPVAVFTFVLRNHLLRGMSFGAIRK